MRAEEVGFDSPFTVTPLRAEDVGLAGLVFVRIPGERFSSRCCWVHVEAMEGSRLWVPGDVEVSP